MNYGVILKNHREGLSISQEDLAAEMDRWSSSAIVSMKENGKRLLERDEFAEAIAACERIAKRRLDDNDPAEALS